jgi:DNA-directed RNA polymerase subunit RPC12/RpoP
MEPRTRICGHELTNGTCKELVTVGKLEHYSDGKLSAIHHVIRCPKCGTRIEIKRSLPALKNRRLKELFTAVRGILEETAAYRAHFAKADINYLMALESR